MAGCLLEAAVAQISKQQFLLIVRKRHIAMAVFGDDGAVDGEKVEPPIVVEIKPRRAPPGVRPAEPAKPRLCASVTKRRMSIVQIQIRSLARQLGHDEI